MFWNISESFFNVKFFACITSSGTSSTFFLQLPFSFGSISLPSLGLRAAHVISYTVAGTTCQIGYSSYIWFKYHFQHYHFFCAALIFVGQFPLSIIHFCKISRGLITRRQEANTTTCFAVCAWIEQQMCGDQPLTGFERSDMVGHWSRYASVIYLLVICGMRS